MKANSIPVSRHWDLPQQRVGELEEENWPSSGWDRVKEQKSLLRLQCYFGSELNWTCQTSSFHDWFCLAMVFVKFANCCGGSLLWTYKTTYMITGGLGTTDMYVANPRPHIRPHSPAYGSYAVHCCTHSQYSLPIKMISLSYCVTFFISKL